MTQRSTFFAATRAILIVLALAGPWVSAACAADWRGFYLGANGGYGYGTGANGLTINDGALLNCHFCDNVFGGGPTVDHLIAQDAGSPRLHPRGFNGGLQFGYNWQTANWVFGLETDLLAFRQRDTADKTFILPGNTALAGGGGVCGATGPETCIGNFSTKLSADWLVTVRPRIGYSYGNTLIYGTFGVALTRLKFEQNYSDNITYPLVPGSTGAGGQVRTSSSALRAGWVLGGGFEHLLQRQWSVKAEYLFVYFDGVAAAARLTDGFGGFADFVNDVNHYSSNIVRLGLNYKLQAPPR